jgi:choline dehydrogenase-like flavoprotein
LTPGETVQNRELNRNEAPTAYLRTVAYTAHDPVSTCRMGNDAAAVLNLELHVRSMDGPLVTDGSVFPAIFGDTTNKAVVMIAEKASNMILGHPSLLPRHPCSDTQPPRGAHHDADTHRPGVH